MTVIVVRSTVVLLACLVDTWLITVSGCSRDCLSYGQRGQSSAEDLARGPQPWVGTQVQYRVGKGSGVGTTSR